MLLPKLRPKRRNEAQYHPMTCSELQLHKFEAQEIERMQRQLYLEKLKQPVPIYSHKYFGEVSTGLGCTTSKHLLTGKPSGERRHASVQYG